MAYDDDDKEKDLDELSDGAVDELLEEDEDEEEEDDDAAEDELSDGRQWE